MKRFTFAMALVGLVVGGIAIAEKSISMEGIKCPVRGTAAKQEHAVKHLDGNVYFCCGNCPKKFEADKATYTTKANQQLVSTKQYEQGACPFSGKPLDASTAIDVNGTKVAFCCNICKGKAEKMKDEEKLTSIFGEKAFAKAKFAKVAEKK
ncbi:MAG: hypothetical protein SGI77_15220 [Pirellulaceae bacterium]|nr:hypothetical protein [Pirellulaceae bacterium]